MRTVLAALVASAFAAAGCSALLDVGALGAGGADGGGAPAGGDDATTAGDGEGTDATAGDDAGGIGDGGATTDGDDAAPRLSYVDTVKADGPIVYWRFRETSSATPAKDEMGHYDGTWQGAPTLGAAGPFTGSTAVQLDGVDDVMTVADGFLSTPWPAITLEGWGAAATTNTEGWFFGWDVTAGTGCSFGVFRDYPTLHLEFHDHSCTALVGVTVPAVSTFYHVVVTVDAANAGRLYVDGVLEAQGTIPGRPPTGHFLVGANYDGVDGGGVVVSDLWHGSLGELAVYDKALSAAQVAAHYAAARP